MPAAHPSLNVRSFQPGDLAGTVEVLERALPGEPISSERFTRQVLLDPNFDCRGAAVACAEERVIGVCIGIARQTPLENAPPDSDRGYITLIAVDPCFTPRRTGQSRWKRRCGHWRSRPGLR
ncbi:MAG: hypothetical protein LC772_10200 [Chloroflexi bacterium]|nr:hypothetical protein [Chloroflexota bacterium]